MYRKFLANENLMTLLNWLLEHSMSEYSADSIQMFTEIYNPEEFVMLLHLLYTLEICNVDADEELEELTVSLNQESELVKAFNTIKNKIELKSFETIEISDVLEKKKSYTVEALIDELINNPNVDLDKFINQCKNYELLLDEEDEDGFHKDLYERLKELDDNDELDIFIEFLEDIKKLKTE